MTDFQLHPQLAADTLPVGCMQLSTTLLMNDRRFPWLILVPRLAGATELVDLSPDHQAQLLTEINIAAHALKTLFTPDKLNIAALGNVTPQLHVHIIARFHGDAAWPRPVWGVGQAETYDSQAAQSLVRKLSGIICAD
jgi:diadenosine tetraphosphate (Ap4A) HIT family hydrolase